MDNEEKNKNPGVHGSPPYNKTPESEPASPYTSPICYIYFKSRRPFTIHHDLVRTSPVLNSICTTFNKIHAEKLPDDAGHILVHFLYMGTYPTLRDCAASTEFITSVYVYAAARLLRLPALVNLSKERLSHYAGALTPEKVVTLAAEVGELLEKDDSWFFAFIKAYLRQLFQDPATPNKSALLESFHRTTTYSNMLVEGIMQICRDSMVPGHSNTSQPLSSVFSEPIATPPVSSRDSTCGLWPHLTCPSATVTETKSAAGEPSLSHPEADQALNQERILEEEAQSAVISAYKKAKGYMKEEKFPEAIELLERVHRVRENSLAETDPSRLETEYKLALAYLNNKQNPEAIDLHEHLAAVEQKTLEETNSRRLLTEHNLGMAYFGEGRILSAITCLEHVVDVEKNLPQEADSVRQISQRSLQVLYETVGERLFD